MRIVAGGESRESDSYHHSDERSQSEALFEFNGGSTMVTCEGMDIIPGDKFVGTASVVTLIRRYSRPFQRSNF